MNSRRDFIKISALGLGGIAFGTGSCNWLNELSESTVIQGLNGFKKTATYCEICFWKCAAWTYVNEKQEIQKIIGHEDDPHCNGRLCPRGTGGVGMYYDKDRLTTPLIRVTENGKQTYKKASWDEALDLIAKNLKRIKEKYGAESVALFKHGSSGHYFEHLLKAYGTNNIAAPSYAQCRGPREVGFSSTFGFTVGSPEPTDIRDTRCLVLIGSHIGENMHNGQVQEMSDAIDKNATIITVDPRFSTAASKSTHWLPIKPATDIALLMAWVHVIIDEELYDKEYLENYATGFEELKQHVHNMTPEWAYGITGIKPEVIRETARAMGHASPAVIIHPGRHVVWYGDDTQRTRAIAILNALLGSWGRRGGFYFKEKVSVPHYPHPTYPTPVWSWRETHHGKYPLAGLAVSNTLIEASLPDNKENRIRSWFISGTNLPLTIPMKGTFEKAVNALDFVVVVDTMPMEVTGYADVVLPECTYLERYDDLRTSPHREPYLALREPALEPLGNSKPASWMARQLGIKMGLKDYFNYEDYTEVLDWQLKQVGSSLQEMKKLGVKKFPRTTPLYLEDGQEWDLYTNSGKIELYATELEENGFDPLPNYTAHPEPEAGYYRLNYGRAPMHTFSRTANNPNLTDLMDENKLWVNPKVAAIWGLKKEQKVWLKNQDGVVSTFPIKVRITERIRWDSIYMVHGFGHSKKELTQAFGKGANDSELITNIMTDPIMGGTGFRGNFVTFLLEKQEEEHVTV